MKKLPDYIIDKEAEKKILSRINKLYLYHDIQETDLCKPFKRKVHFVFNDEFEFIVEIYLGPGAEKEHKGKRLHYWIRKINMENGYKLNLSQHCIIKESAFNEFFKIISDMFRDFTKRSGIIFFKNNDNKLISCEIYINENTFTQFFDNEKTGDDNIPYFCFYRKKVG